ncbi:MAG TPA: 30S ribosomal protein S20 [Candidatus Fermentibacter daniensis]|nr:30S ribosomal protein S20 [Candidatus Fermentibacter daniensis]HOR06856.1 30S ribosomal protein S20 [Candidatus Fermentibacter daniensis]HPK51085.1 30S ribosomal protein S20 [Candidatus Fermentibacter daniensis]HQE56491.1 30S ribosomal protein S20 [Candidatus Fermentibacter daniensis]HQH92105.1 30S ribosomal protein S20 [Candidatus Fermentibacter daniensis]
MARSTSAAKNMRKDARRHLRIRSQIRTLRTAMRRVREAGSAEEGAEAMKVAQSLLDRAGRKRLVHPNTADRIKSRLAARIRERS